MISKKKDTQKDLDIAYLNSMIMMCNHIVATEEKEEFRIIDSAGLGSHRLGPDGNDAKYSWENDFGKELSATDKNNIKVLVYKQIVFEDIMEELLQPYGGLLTKADELTSWKWEELKEETDNLYAELEKFGYVSGPDHFPDYSAATMYVHELQRIYRYARHKEKQGKNPWILWDPENDPQDDLAYCRHPAIPHGRRKDEYIYCVINMDYNSFRRRYENGMDFYDAVFLPTGRYSLGEMFIKETLDRMKAKYEEQYKIASCADINPLPFDFAVFKDDNLSFLIEFQGKQHYKPTTFGTRDKAKGQKIWETQVRHDAMKKKWCSDNNVPLLEIDYHDINRTSQIVEDYCRKMGVV